MNRTDKDEDISVLRESEKHYRMLIDESMDPTFSFYRDGTYRYVNKAFAKGVGKDASDIIGKKIWDVFAKDEADKRFAVVKKVFTTAEIVEIEVRVPLPAGDTYYLTTAKPIMSKEGKVETVICTSKNITSRKIAELALKEKYDNLLQAVEEAKTLSGLLPVCVSCKNIRDEDGSWKTIDTFLRSTLDIDISHGICPQCAENLYGQEDWYKKRFSKSNDKDREGTGHHETTPQQQ